MNRISTVLFSLFVALALVSYADAQEIKFKTSDGKLKITGTVGYYVLNGKPVASPKGDEKGLAVVIIRSDGKPTNLLPVTQLSKKTKRILFGEKIFKKTPPPLFAIPPFGEEQALSYQRQWSEYLGKPVEFTNSIGMEFMLIPPGEFIMGYDVKDALLSPQHKVVITKPFYLGKYEVTSGEHSFMGRNKRGGKTPAILSHAQSESFANWLRTKEPGSIYRLPTEAEWELAHRAGRVDLPQKQQVALALKSGWYKENSGGRVHEVGELPPNPYGLYDMFGNVGETTSDFHYVFPAIAERSDPQSPATWAESLRQCKLRGDNPHGPRKLYRGGTFSYPYLHGPVPWFMYSGRHSGFTNQAYGCLGARLVLEIN